MNKIIFALLVILPFVMAEISFKDNFDSFLAKHGKKYEGEEYERRLMNYINNHHMANRQAKMYPETNWGETKFFDMSHEEFVAVMLPQSYDAQFLAEACMQRGIYKAAPTDMDLPDSFDWRDQEGVVTSVKDQAQCGSCWAFSTAAAMEGQVGLHSDIGGTSFSPQYIIDCSKGCTSEIFLGTNTTVCNGGCNGGWPWTAFSDINRDLGGVPDWDSVPYKGYTNAKCDGLDNAEHIAKLSGYTCVTGEEGISEEELARSLVANGPLSIAVDAGTWSWYNGGIFDSSCDASYLNHAVLLVGYGSENGKDYWIIKNSWNTNWGEDGYIRMAKGKNLCGITEGASFPNLESAI